MRSITTFNVFEVYTDNQTWAGTVRDLGQQWKDAFVFFKHEESGEGPRLAADFAARFGSPPIA